MYPPATREAGATTRSLQVSEVRPERSDALSWAAQLGHGEAEDRSGLSVPPDSPLIGKTGTKTQMGRTLVYGDAQREATGDQTHWSRRC